MENRQHILFKDKKTATREKNPLLGKFIRLKIRFGIIRFGIKRSFASRAVLIRNCKNQPVLP
jgi:hypothetical protein